MQSKINRQGLASSNLLFCIQILITVLKIIKQEKIPCGYLVYQMVKVYYFYDHTSELHNLK